MTLEKVMSVPATPVNTPSRPAVAFNHKRLADWMIGFAVFTGGFVVFEPAPYELLLAGMIGLFFLLGLRLHRGMLPLLVAVTTFTLGGLISSFMIEDYMRGVIYNAVTLFLGLTSVFFALVIYQDPARIRLIFRAYVLAAAATAMLGIIGYFGVPGFGLFTKFSRAQGAFADPNVFAPFLMVPMLYLVYGIMNRSVTMAPIRAGFLLIILLGIFLAFSRAGWGLTVVTSAMFYFLLLVNAADQKTRAKYILMGVAGLAAVIMMIGVALQFEAVSSLFSERAQVVQSYDGNRLGRFARHAIGFEMATRHPFGIGNLEFGFLMGEDEHNVYLRALLSYGWLGFASWMFIVITPLVIGFPMLFKNRPWQVYFQICFVVFLGHLMVAWVIDIDHWRHFYLLLGVMWGCILLERKWQGEHTRQTGPRTKSLSTYPATPQAAHSGRA